jgi:hypothetical protein
MTDERLWTTQEIIYVLAALHAARDTLPRPFRFLLKGWNEALSRLGGAILQEERITKSFGEYMGEPPRIWTRQEFLGLVDMIFEASNKAGKEALCAAHLALYGVVQEGAAELDPEIWGKL